MASEFTTEVGRLVQGDPFKPNTTNQAGQPLTDKNGNPREEYFIAVAFEKGANSYFNTIWALMNAEAKAGHAHLFDAAGNCTRSDFSWKLIDGDGMDQNGQPYSNRQGFANHWVLRFVSGFKPTCYSAGGEQVLNDPNAIKRGYYVRVHGNIRPNDSQQSPGIYINFDMVELVGFGEEISSGPDGATVFGASQAVLPAGASATPVAGPQSALPAPAPAPAAPSAPSAPPAPPAPAAPSAPSAPPAPPAPANDMLNPQPKGLEDYVTDLAKSQGFTYTSLLEANWSPEQMLQAGYISDIPPF